MKIKAILNNNRGTSMFFAVLLFFVMTVLGISLLNAVSSNQLDTRREIEKEQTILYMTSVYEIVNEMICSGDFLSSDTSKMPASATAEFSAGEETIKVELYFTEKSSLQAEIIILYLGQKYEINNFYKKMGTSYTLERCNGLEGA